MVAADSTFANTHVAVDVRVTEETEPSWVGVACRVTIQGDAVFYSLDVCPLRAGSCWPAMTPNEPCFLCRNDSRGRSVVATRRITWS